jgi:hypothetical protein
MESFLKTRLTLVWLVLIAITGASLALGRGWERGGRDAAAAAVLIAAFVKVRIVAFEFMELRSAPRAVRWGLSLWLAAVCVALCMLFLPD